MPSVLICVCRLYLRPRLSYVYSIFNLMNYHTFFMVKIPLIAARYDSRQHERKKKICILCFQHDTKWNIYSKLLYNVSWVTVWSMTIQSKHVAITLTLKYFVDPSMYPNEGRSFGELGLPWVNLARVDNMGQRVSSPLTRGALIRETHWCLRTWSFFQYLDRKAD